MMFLLTSGSGSMVVGSGSTHIDVYNYRVDLDKPCPPKCARVEIESVCDIDQLILKLQSMRYTLRQKEKAVT